MGIYICEQKIPFGVNVPKAKSHVLDHDRIISEEGQDYGNFRGPAHHACNLNYRIKLKHWKLPVFFHNLKGYENHLIVKHLNNSHGKIRVIPNNIEK